MSFLTSGSTRQRKRNARRTSVSHSGTANRSSSVSRSYLSRNDSTRTPMSTSGFVRPIVASVLEGTANSRGNIGVAAVDLYTMDFSFFSFTDLASYTSLKSKLEVLDPAEVLVCDSGNEKGAVLHEAIRNCCDASLSGVPRRYFDTYKGKMLFQRLKSSSVEGEPGDLAAAAFNALIKYVEHIEGIIFAGSSIRFSFDDNEKICLLDVETRRNLEITDGFTRRKDRQTLLGLLDRTMTVMGGRLLRQSLLQPLADQVQIERRLDALQELIERPHLLERVREVLSRVCNVHMAIGVIVMSAREKTVRIAENNIAQVIQLYQTLSLVQPLLSILSNMNSPLITEKLHILADGSIPAIIECLQETLDAEVLQTGTRKNSMASRNQRCFIVRPGLSVAVDVARKAYEELLMELETQNHELEDYLPNQNVRIAFSAARSFHYLWVHPNANRVKVPAQFTNIVRNKASLTFSSRLMMRYNDRIEQSVNEVLLASDDVIGETIEKIRPRVSSLYQLVDVISLVDFLCALAIYSDDVPTVRPHFGDDIVMKEGRFPLFDLLGPKVVPNDVYLTRQSRCALITGPNMAGKSSYIRQVGAVCVLAQMGCYVPAVAVSLPIFTRICSRVGHNDTLSENLSSFAVEMRDMELILRVTDQDSLVLIDELGRSTSVEEGISITVAILEDLLDKECFVVLASHFLDLSSLDAVYSAIENFHFSSHVQHTPEGDAFVPSHSLLRGAYSGPLYGFELAELSAFPPEMMERARSLAGQLQSEWAERQWESDERKRQRELVRLGFAMRSVLGASADPREVLRSLVQLREQFIEAHPESPHESLAP